MPGDKETATDVGALRVLVHAELPQAEIDSIRAAAGPEATLFVLPDAEEAARRLPDVEVAFGHFPAERIAAAAPALRWVQVPSAGVEEYITNAMKQSGVVLTNGRGVYGVAGAEHVLGQMLMFTRRLKELYDFQRAGRWAQEDYAFTARLQGQTLGIVGLGGIGAQVAIRAKAFGMTVLAVKRRPGEKPPYVDHLWGTDGLFELLAASDHVVLALPLTPHTQGLVDAAALARMKPTAYLYNIGRGAVVDEPALVRRLEAGQLAGAGLDVFVEEPLPPESPLWRLPNVLVTPHAGADGPQDWADTASLFADNLRRYRAGHDLINVVDLEHGY